MSFGNVYPRDDIVAVIDDQAQAERAVQALKDAGVAANDVDLLDPSFILESNQDLARHRGPLGRLAAALGDEGGYMKLDLAEAEQGHWIAVVHAPRPADIERVRRVLAAHGARNMRHYGQTTMTDLD